MVLEITACDSKRLDLMIQGSPLQSAIPMLDLYAEEIVIYHKGELICRVKTQSFKVRLENGLQQFMR